MEHHRQDQLNVRVCIGIGSAIFHQVFFAHLGSPKVLVLDGWNEGRGKRGTLMLVKEVPSFRAGRWSWRADGHRPSHKAVRRFAILSVLRDDCAPQRQRCPVLTLGHQLNQRVRNTCPIVQILHCLDPFSMC